MGRNYGKVFIPSKSGGGGGGGENKNYNQHDDRDSSNYCRNGRGGGGRSGAAPYRGDGGQGQGGSGGWSKKVSFAKKGGGFIKKKKGSAHSRLGNIILEDDEGMDGGPPHNTDYQSHYHTNAGRARPPGGAIRGQRGGKRGRGGRGGRGGGVYISPGLLNRGGGRNLLGKSWHKVTLSGASRYEKNPLLQAMAAHGPFRPLAFHKAGPHYIFYVETREQANNLKSMDNKIAMPDQKNLIVRVETSAPPQVTLNEQVMDKMKLVMSSRYNVAGKALNLRAFHSDDKFVGDDVYCPLNRSTVMGNIVNVITDNIPEIEAIDFSDNRIPTLDHFSTLAEKAPNVKILHLNDNRIYELHELNKCRNWKLTELKLNDNPMVTKFSDISSYQSAVRKIFPNLIKLDGKELEKLITFDDDDDDVNRNFKIPPSVAKMACNEQAGSIVLQFLEQYISAYDSDNRQSLMDAYHEEAVMSLSSAYPVNTTFQGSKKLDSYILESRNLFRVTDGNRRCKLLRRGKLAIVSFLNDLPKTTHDIASITLDVPFATERLMTFTVTGIFKERAKINDPPLRHFNRMFVVVPQRSGFVIVNETFFITNPTAYQSQIAFTDKPVQVQPVLDDHAKRMMAIEVAQKTGMNNEWAAQCLDQTKWDLNAALAAFQTAKNEGKIPPEAFVRNV